MCIILTGSYSCNFEFYWEEKKSSENNIKGKSFGNINQQRRQSQRCQNAIVRNMLKLP